MAVGLSGLRDSCPVAQPEGLTALTGTQSFKEHGKDLP